MEHFYQGIPGWFDFEDVYAEMVKLAPRNAHFVEIGAFQGKSTSFMAVEIINSKKEILFDVIDTWEGSVEHQQGGMHESASVIQRELFDAFRKNMKPVAYLINPIRMPSLDAVSRFKDASLDFVFIDASHDYENVKADILAWRPKVKPGGYLGGHDFQAIFPGVIQAVKELIPNFKVSKFAWYAQISS